jgi:tetratricopeptide (TPR) repeat protein
LAKDYENLGAIQAATGDQEGAATSFRQAIAIFSKLAASMPGDIDYRLYLALNLANLGGVQSEMGQPRRAEESSRRALEIGTGLLKERPDAPEVLSMIGIALGNLGTSLDAQGCHIDAESAFRQAIERQKIACEKAPWIPQFREALSSHYVGLTRTLGAQKRPDEAVQVAWQNRALCKTNPAELYNASSGLAFCVSIAGEASGKKELAGEAVHALREAVRAGWKDAQKIGRDRDWDPLRSREDFRHLLAEMLDRGFPADPFAP